MEIDRKELKRQAREAIGLAKPKFWIVALTFILMTDGPSLLATGLSYVFPSSLDGLSQFLSILITLYTMVIVFGFDLWSLWTHRKMDPDLGALTQGFSVGGRVIWLNILILLRTLGWAMLFALLTVLLIPIHPAAYAVGLCAAVVATWLMTLRYSMAPFLLADYPDEGAGAAIHRSVLLTRGWSWELAKLELSFCGWMLLIALLEGAVMVLLSLQNGLAELIAAGISFGRFDYAALTEMLLGHKLAASLGGLIVTTPVYLWLTPYRNVARAGFYDALLHSLREKSSPVL